MKGGGLNGAHALEDATVIDDHSKVANRQPDAEAARIVVPAWQQGRPR